MQHNTFRFSRKSMCLIISAVCFLWSEGSAFAQSVKTTVNFYSSDSLLITADEYVISDTLPYLVLFHEQGSSRGEFSEIIDRFQKMNFNCLATDIRNGGNSNYIPNQTARRSRIESRSRSVDAVSSDIEAAIAYATEKSSQNVILLGAGANGSLVLKAAMEQEQVKAAVALSPGEFFLPVFSTEESISGIRKPLLITSSRMEHPYMVQLLSNVEEEYKTIFVPETSDGERGSAALLPENPSYSEYWLAILLFFKELQ
jgi:hypothetical protein